MESLNWAYRGSIAGVVMSALPMGLSDCSRDATVCGAGRSAWVLNRFGGGAPKCAANPGLTPSFRRSLPETGCLSQGLPAGYAARSLCPPKRLSTRRACATSDYLSSLERDLRRQLEGARAQAFGLRGLLEHEIRRRREDAAAEGVEIRSEEHTSELQ